MKSMILQKNVFFNLIKIISKFFFVNKRMFHIDIIKVKFFISKKNKKKSKSM